MERRNALRNIGLGLGYMAATPTILSMLQSCNAAPDAGWAPQFFTYEQAMFITTAVDVILPKTDTPGASEVNVPQFIDRFYAEILKPEDQTKVREGLEAFVALAATNGGSDATAITTALEKTLKVAPSMGQEAGPATDFAYELRGKTIWSYKSAEYVGEEVLAYLPVPGEYLPCEDLQELTGGKAYTF
jgi:hypothetical protein